jgi:hypothetical protein
MKKYLGQILSSILLGISLLLALSFWLNVKFGFNLFYAQHWDELAQLQASHEHINNMFYVSIGTAILVFIVGLYMIFKPRQNITISKDINMPKQKTTTNVVIENNIEHTQQDTTRNAIILSSPPKLNLPKNTAKLALQRYAEMMTQQNYDSQLFEIFTNAGYVIKPNITVNGFTTNLFAIGTGEKVWFGAIDCDQDKFKSAVNRLNSIFIETLEDVPINVSAFILDTKGLYNTDDDALVFHTLDELKEFMAIQLNPPLTDSERENFDAYSNYIDTVIQYAKNA